MRKKMVALVTSASLSFGWPQPASSAPDAQVVEWGKFPFRYQSQPTKPDSCIDPPRVAKKAIEGDLKIVFEPGRANAYGEQGYSEFVLRLPLSAKPPRDHVDYRGRLKVEIYHIRWYQDFEATLTGTLTPQGIDMVVRYRLEGSSDCWKERYIRSRKPT